MNTIIKHHRVTFDRWLKDPDTVICTFENKDLGHSDLGQRISMPFTVADAAKMEIDKTRCPDSASLIGWRYILVAKATTVEQALINQQSDEQHDVAR